MTYGYTTPAPGIMKFTFLVDPFLVFITTYLVCLVHVPVWTRRGEEILHFHNMAMPTHKNPCPGGHGIYNIGRLFLGHHYY